MTILEEVNMMQEVLAKTENGLATAFGLISDIIGILSGEQAGTAEEAYAKLDKLRPILSEIYQAYKACAEESYWQTNETTLPFDEMTALLRLTERQVWMARNLRLNEVICQNLPSITRVLGNIAETVRATKAWGETANKS